MSDFLTDDKELEEAFDPALRRAWDVSDDVADVRDHDKVRIRKDSLLLSGDACFYTLQGEGPTMGLPCVFCRLHVCNLRCTWCDAFYTWNFNSREFWTEPNRVSFGEAAALISKTWDAATNNENHPRRVIFTGGEPLIQKKQIDEVWFELENETGSWQVELETNGTLMPTEAQLQRAQFNCSPKLSNSDNQHHSMVKPKVLAALNEVNTTFKFVCYDETDLDEIEEKYLPHIDANKIIIMPQGIRSQEIDDNMQNLYVPCMDRGYRLLGRMQAQFASGAKRRV